MYVCMYIYIYIYTYVYIHTYIHIGRKKREIYRAQETLDATARLISALKIAYSHSH